MAATKIMKAQPVMAGGRGGPGNQEQNDLEERCKKYKMQIQKYELEFQRMSTERLEMNELRVTMERNKEALRQKVAEYKREVDHLTEKLTLASNEKSELQRRVEQLNTFIAQLQAEKGVACDPKLVNVGVGGSPDKQLALLNQAMERLKEENASLRRQREDLQEAMRRKLGSPEGQKAKGSSGPSSRVERSPQPYSDRDPSQGSPDDAPGVLRRNHTPNHTLYSAKFSQGSLEEESGAPGNLGNLLDTPMSDFSGSQGRSNHSFAANRKLSHSTTNLSGDSSQEGRGSNLQGRSGSEKKLELSQQRTDLLSQVSSLEQLRDKLDTEVKQLRQALSSKDEDITRLSRKLQESETQMEVLNNQKGVALRENSALYEQTMKLQTLLQTVQVEKEILKTQHDVAVGERDKLVGENVTLRKKMESMLAQRQKDAKDLSSMKLLKDKAVLEVGDLRKGVEDLQKEKHLLEEEMGVVRDQLRASLRGTTTSDSVAKDIESLVTRVGTVENEKKMLLKVLFGQESILHSEALRKAEKMVNERDSLLLEVEELQVTASRETEDKILELKQKIEDLMLDKERLTSQIKTLNKDFGTLRSKTSKSEEEKEWLMDEIRRLTEQCSTLETVKNRLVEEQTKTLERADKLWKQRPINWDDAWEEKQIEFSLGPDGLAGFSVAGGRDQPQLPNPGAIIVTTVTKGSPADGQLRVGDVLEAVNGVNMSCADHRDAVRAVKDSSMGTLQMMVRRRKYATTIQVGIVSVVNGLEPRVEEQEFSLMVNRKDGVGFKYDWTSVYTVTEVTSSGPADQILKPGDKITKINNTPITREKPSVVKKILKPHHTILKLVIQREVHPDGTRPHDTRPQESTPKLLPASAQPVGRQSSSSIGHGRGLSGSSIGSWRERPTEKENFSSNSDNDVDPEESQSPDGGHHSDGHLHGHHSDGYSQNSEDNSRPTKLAPTKLVAMVTKVKQNSRNPNEGSSDAEIEGSEDYNERRIEYDNVLTSEATSSQVYDSYLSEGCSYDAYPSSTSQSIDLPFSSAAPAVSHNRLTVDTMTATCPQEPPSNPSPSSDDETSLSRNHKTRTTCIRKSSITGAGSKEEQVDGATQDSTPKHKASKIRNRSKSKSIHGSMSQVSEVTPTNRVRSRSSSSLNHGKSWSNLTHACSMTSVREEDTRRSTSSFNVSQSQDEDPLTGATNIRANFTFIPRNPKELSVKPGNVFHILDEEPSKRFKASFRVSRLNDDGTDAQSGLIPNSTRAQELVEAQGETVDFPLYEEVEPYTHPRPMLIFGALADQVVSHLFDRYPNLFYHGTYDIVEAVHTPGRLTEARLNRELGEGKIADFRRTESGNSFAVLKMQTLMSRDHKGQHCLLVGTAQVLYKLKNVAPPISILVKAISQDSISTFTTKPITPQYAADMYKDVLAIVNDSQLYKEFSASIFLTHMEVLVQQIEEVMKKEKQKQAWIVVTKTDQ